VLSKNEGRFSTFENTKNTVCAKGFISVHGNRKTPQVMQKMYRAGCMA
jgi:hypothetical protein